MINWFIDKYGVLKAWIVRNGKIILVTLVAVLTAASLANLPSDEVPYVDVNGEIIAFLYTDDNTGENILIRTDRELYGAFNENELVTTYVLMGNNSGKSQNVSIYPTFNSYATDVEISRLYQDMPYDTEIPVYEEQCKIVNSTTTVSETVCNNVLIGTSTQIAYRDEWRTEPLTVFDEFEISVNLSKGSLERKVIPPEYKAIKKSITYIDSDEIAYFKIQFRGVPPRITDEFFFEIVGDEGAYGHLDPTITSDWTGYFPITATTTITDTHANFPLYYNGVSAPADCTTVLKSDGTDIRITTSTAIGSMILDNELISATTTAGNWEIYFRDPSLAASNVYYVWCGNAGASDISTTSVYNANYLGHWHMGTTTDATVNNQDFSLVATPVVVSGKIGNATDFEEGDGDAYKKTSPSLNHNSLTQMAWVNVESVPSGENDIIIAAIETGSNDPSARLYINTSGSHNFFIRDDNRDPEKNISGGAATASQWDHIVGTYASSTGVTVFYLNSSLIASTTETTGGVFSGYNELTIGYAKNTEFFDGIVDEASFINIAFSANRIDAIYKNENDQSAFWTIGSWVTVGVERRIISVQ